MIEKLFRKFEDPSQPLLGPNVKALKFFGMLLPESIFMKFIYALMHGFVTMFIMTEYIDIWLVRTNIELLLNNLQITILTSVGFFKFVSYMIWQKRWISIIDYVTTADIENRKTTNSKNVATIDKFTRYCRKMTFVQSFFFFLLNCVVVLLPIIKYVSSPIYRQNLKNGTEPFFQIVSNWVPFSKNTLPGCLAASFFQDFLVLFGGNGWIAAYDAAAIAIMVFFKGELELLRNDCSEIFATSKDPVTDEEAVRRIKTCHQRHVLLTHYTQLFNSCLSPIMFIYLLVSSFMICATTYQIVMDTSMLQRTSNIALFTFTVVQLFIYCWHANDVFYASTYLMHGPYQSLWWTSSIKLRKNIFILTAQFNTWIIFTAGPFTNLTVDTFINIMKGAYSYYTLLRQSQM